MFLAALGQRERELGSADTFSADERRQVRRQAVRVVTWSLLAGIAMTMAALLAR